MLVPPKTSSDGFTLEGHVVIQIDIQEDDIQNTTICLALQIDPHSHHYLLNVG